MNKFQCSYDNCKRLIEIERTKAFSCCVCGHGTMTMVQPKVSCSNCDSPIYDNVDKGKGIDIICADCTSQLLDGKLVKTDENSRRGKSFGERIRAARKRLKWTQGQAAEYLDLKSKATITNYEKDLRYPKKRVLEKVLGWAREIEGLQKSEIQEWLQAARL